MSLLIGQYQMKDESICDALIDFFNCNKDQHRPGRCYVKKGDEWGVDKEKKDSTDMSLPVEAFSEVDFLKAYAMELSEAMEQYKKDYPGCEIVCAPWGVTEDVNFQHYSPGGGFKVWHSEKSGLHDDMATARTLVFMTYLNTVTDEGGTEFMHQKLTVSAKKGKTVIWPAEWTHTHRGVVSPSQDKYIITGWYSYLNGPSYTEGIPG